MHVYIINSYTHALWFDRSYTYFQTTTDFL